MENKNFKFSSLKSCLQASNSYSFNSRKAFTLIEILIYLGIFAIIAGTLTGILNSVVRIQTRELAGNEVSQQMNFVMSTIQRLVRESSKIEMEAGASGSAINLRMASSTLDPTLIFASGTMVYLQQGTGEAAPLTNSKVKVDNLTFKKYSQYPGHDVVQVNLTMSYNTANPQQQSSQTLQSTIARNSPATFGFDVLPTTTDTYSLGSSSLRFKDLSLSNLLNVGTTSTDPTTTWNGAIYYNTTSNDFRGYKNNAWGALGGGYWTTTSTNDIYNTNSGNVIIGTTTSTAKLTVSNGSIAQNPFNPQLVGSVGTGSNPVSVYVSGRYAYVVNWYSSTLQIFDVSNPASPQLVGSASTGTYAAPFSVYVSGRYAYIVNYSSETLQIFDVSNPANPQLIGSANTGFNPPLVYVSGRYAYVVNKNSNTLQIFDVSNPANPQLIGSANTGTHPLSVYVSGRYAYVVNANSNTLQIFDVSNPANPQLIGSVSTGSGPYSVYVSGRYAYVVNTGNTGSDILQIFDVSNPANPQLIGSANTGYDPYFVYVSGRYAYVVNSSSSTLQIFDVSNPANPQLIGSANTGYNPNSVYVSGRYAYVVNQGSNTLQIFDISGLETTSAMIHSLEAGNLQVRNDIIAQGQVQISGGLNVGSGGIFSAGSLAVATSSKFVGSVSAGWEKLSTTCSSATQCSQSCSANKYLVGGGCQFSDATTVIENYPSASSTWKCTSSASQNITVWAICSNIAP